MNDIAPPLTIQDASHHIQQLRTRLNQVLIGQPDVIDHVIIALLCSGHVLVEGVPGLGKTLLVRALAACFDGLFKRIQFTPDLMPGDITGHVMYDLNESRFHMREGPVFTNLLLADEINRAPAKTQAALLEVMQEKQVTLEGTPRTLPLPFMVLATQNPIEQEGTYPLPEAELDRFLMKLFIDYPSLSDEIELTRQVIHGHIDDTHLTAPAFLKANDIVRLQASVTHVAVDEHILDYAVRLVRATRDSTAFARGAGSRACIALVRAARAHALLRSEAFVLPDDIKAMALPVMRHRVALSADAEIDGLTPDYMLRKLLNTVEAPHA